MNSHRLIISPGGCFMKRQQLVWLFLSLSGCLARMIPGRDWTDLLSFLSPVLHLILHFTLSLCCLSFSYFDGLSFYWNQSSLQSCWDGGVWTSTQAIWITAWVVTETKATLPGEPLTSSLPSLMPRVRGQSRTGGSRRFHTQIYTLRT